MAKQRDAKEAKIIGMIQGGARGSEVARVVGVSRQRIHQIWKRATGQSIPPSPFCMQGHLLAADPSGRRWCPTCAAARAASRPRKGRPPLITHCLRGHEYTPENTYWWRDRRLCRECFRVRAQQYRQDPAFRARQKENSRRYNQTDKARETRRRYYLTRRASISAPQQAGAEGE